MRRRRENRLTQVVGEAVTTYRYNGDGGRVSLTTGCTTTTYIGNYFEWTGSAATMTSYYYAGGMRVALRAGTPLTGTVNYLLGDHLGSTSVSYRSDGSQTATQRYYPWGSVRATTGGVLPTDYTFTGQKLDASAGLLYYGARYYDSALGRFIQADTIVPNPGDPQALNRYSYVGNRPTVYRDPSGHCGPCVLLPILLGVALMVKSDTAPLDANGQLVTDPSSAFSSQLGGSLVFGDVNDVVTLATGYDHIWGEPVPYFSGKWWGQAGLAVAPVASGSALRALSRFNSLDQKVIPKLLGAFGDASRAAGDIPDALKGRNLRVLGRLEDTTVAKEMGMNILDLPQPHAPVPWSVEANVAWMQNAIDNGDVIYLGTPINANSLAGDPQYGGIAVFARELDMLLQAGYRRVGDYLLPPQ